MYVTRQELERHPGIAADLEALESRRDVFLRMVTPEIAAAQKRWEHDTARKLVKWTALEFKTLRSEKGVRFTREPDNVIRVRRAVAASRLALGRLVTLEVEVDTLGQLEEALEARADAVLLDNMSIPDLERAVASAGGRVPLEASGGITPENIRDVAATGVDVISVGWITHSAPALDVGLDFSISS